MDYSDGNLGPCIDEMRAIVPPFISKFNTPDPFGYPVLASATVREKVKHIVQVVSGTIMDFDDEDRLNALLANMDDILAWKDELLLPAKSDDVISILSILDAAWGRFEIWDDAELSAIMRRAHNEKTASAANAYLEATLVYIIDAFYSLASVCNINHVSARCYAMVTDIHCIFKHLRANAATL